MLLQKQIASTSTLSHPGKGELGYKSAVPVRALPVVVRNARQNAHNLDVEGDMIDGHPWGA